MADRVRRPHPFRVEEPRANVVRNLKVASVEDLAPRYRRVRFSGPELGAFAGNPAMQSSGFDDVAVLFFAGADGTIARPIAHESGALLPDAQGRVVAREYTVRDLDDDAMTIDFVLHESGVASSWAQEAMPGDELVIVGPRVSRALATSPRFVALGDSTALAAMQRLRESAPNAELFAAVPADLQSQVPQGTQVIPADADCEATICALETREFSSADTTFWIAGESSFVTGLRRYLVSERGIDRSRIQFTGYWRRGESGLLEHQPED